MSEVLVVFDGVLDGDDGRPWTAQACGRVAGDGLWEGWIEFVPRDHVAAPVRSPRETEQPNRDDLLYWAQGLTHVYLQGALRRALARPVEPARTIPAEPHFDGPARHAPGLADAIGPRPVLNPFDVYVQGESVLLRQLGALDAGHLRDIVDAYGFADAVTAGDAGREELTSLIVRGVRRGAAPPQPGVSELRE